MRLRLFIITLVWFCSSFAHGQTSLKAGMLDLEVRGKGGAQVEADLAVVMSRTIRSLIRGQRRWREVGKLSASLSDAKLAFGCDAVDTKCMKGLAKTLGVKVLLWGTVQRDHSMVTLKIWGVSDDGATKMIEKRLNRKTIQKKLKRLKKRKGKQFEKELRIIGQPVVDALLKQPDRLIQFVVNTEPTGAEIFINGQTVGTSPVTIPLRPGNYQIELRAVGYDVSQQTLQISAGSRPRQTWLLTPSKQSWAADRKDSSARQIVRWSSLGIATVALASSAFFFNEANQVMGNTQDTLCAQKPTECGGSPALMTRSLISEREFESRQSEYQKNSALYYSSLALTTVAVSTFASTFFFEWE